MLRLVIFVSIFSLVYGLISIKSKPAKVANRQHVDLVCNVGTMRSPVKWVYGGRTYFSCNSPYTNCVTHTDIETDGFYDFTINNDSLSMLFLVNKNQNDGIWSCYHGNEKADFEIDNADAPHIPYFRDTFLGGVNRDFSFRCTIESEVPADVVIFSQTYLGLRKLYEKKQTKIADHEITASIPCEDYKIYCNVSNGYGPTVTDFTTVRENCPLKILYNLSPNTTLVFNETIDELELKVHYEGYPHPSPALHRITTDGIQGVTKDFSLYQSYYPTLHESRLVRIVFRRLESTDAGKYVLTLKHGVAKAIPITLVYMYTGKTTTGRSNQPTPTPPTTTSRTPEMTVHVTDIKTTRDNFPNILERETKDATKMIPDVGVAGFVISLLLILILVIVGVVWFKRIKKKQTGSADQNQVYSTTVQTTSNRPNQIYENVTN